MSFNPQGFHLRRQGKIDSKTKHKMICFKKADSLIGRDEEADFQITDIENTQSISRKHFRILFRDNKMFIESIEGKKVIVNGSKLNGLQELAVGSLIGFGRHAPGSDEPAVQFKVEGCITLDSSDEELEIKHESADDLLAGLDELPGLLEQESVIQVISDDEEYEKAKSWQEKLQFKGRNEKNSRSAAPLVRIEKSSSQSNDTLPGLSELPQASSTPRASKAPAKSFDDDDFYPTSSLYNLPPMRGLVIEVEVLDDKFVQRMLRRRVPITPARENAAPKKRKTKRGKIKRSYAQPTAFDRAQALADPDSESEEDSDAGSSFSAASSFSNGSSENRAILRKPDQKRRRQEDANNNRVPITQRKDGKPGTSKNIPQQNRKVAGPKSVKLSMGISASDDSRDSSDEAPKPAKKPRGMTAEAPQQRNAIKMTEAKPISKMKRRMSMTDLDPTTSSAFNKNRRVGAQVSGRGGKETAQDQLSKVWELRNQLEEKDQAEIEKTAQRPLSELEKKEHKPLVNTGPKTRVSRYAQKALEQVAPAALKIKPAEAPGTSEVKPKPQQSAANKNQEKPEASKPRVQTKPKVKVTKNNRFDLMVESFKEPTNANKPPPASSNANQLPAVSSLPRIPRISERRTSESDKPEASDSPASNNDMQEQIQSLKAQYANGIFKKSHPATISRTDSSPNQNGASTSGARSSNEVWSNKPATKPGFRLGFYNPIETPFDDNSCEDFSSSGGINIDALEPTSMNVYTQREVAAAGVVDNESAEPAPPGVDDPLADLEEYDSEPDRPIPKAPRVICTPEPNLLSILKRGGSSSGKKKSLTIAEHLNERRTFFVNPDDWDAVPTAAPVNPPANSRSGAPASPRFNQSPRLSPSSRSSPSPPSSFLDAPLRASESPSASSMTQRNPSVRRDPRSSPSPRSNQSPNGSSSFLDEPLRAPESPSTSSTFQRNSSTQQEFSAPRDPRPAAQANNSLETFDHHARVLIKILRWSPDEMDVQANPLHASYDDLHDFRWTVEGIIKPKLFQKIRDCLDEADKQEHRDSDWVFLKRHDQKNGLTRLVLSCTEGNQSAQTFSDGDFLQIKMHNKTENCDENFFGHIRGTQRELSYGQQELFVDTIVDKAKLADISVMRASKVCSIYREVITLLSLEKLTETEIVKKMLRPGAITSPAVITQKLFPSRNGFDLSLDQSLVVSTLESSFDRGFKADQPISAIQANPGSGKTTTLVESVLLILEKAKKQKTPLPSIAICAKTDAGVKTLGEMLLSLTNDSDFTIVIIGDVDSVALKPITLRTLAQQNPTKEISKAVVVITKIEQAHELYTLGKKFDICFVDEASRCSELETIVPLYITTKKLVLFGDTVHPGAAFEPKKDSSLFERIIRSFSGKCQTPVMALKPYQPGIQFAKYNPTNGNNFY